MGSADELPDDELAVGIAPLENTSTPRNDDEPPYGWVVCMSMHLINGFTWGIIAVWFFIFYA